MSKEGDRQSVFRTTKVRTALKGDNSWIQRRSESEVEQEQEQEEKPWVAEVRANRTNGVFADPNPSASPAAASSTPPASPTSSEGAKASSGYLIRGVFTRTDTEKAPSVTNGTSATSTTFIKKPTESYKKIAPHILRSGTGGFAQDDDLLSTEEHERRTEAASGVLRSSAVRQRSYVLSAAKKYEAVDQPKVIPSFVVKRVVIDEDDESTEMSKEVKLPAPTPQSTAPQPSSKDSKPTVELKTATPTGPVKSSPDVNTFTALSDTIISQKSHTPSAVDTQKPSLALDPNSSLKMQKPSTALEPSPLKPTSSKDTKVAVEQKMETSPLKTSLVNVQKVNPAPEPSPTTPASSKDTKLPVEQKRQASPVKTSSAEAAKLSPALDPSPMVLTSSAAASKLSPALGPSPLVLTSSKDTKLSVEQKPKTESSPVKPSPVVNTFTALSDTLISPKSNTPSSPPEAPATSDTSEDLDIDDLIAVGDSDSAVDLLDPFPVDTTKSSTKPADPVPVRTISIKSTIDPVALSEISEDSKPTEISDSTVNLLDPFPVDTKSSPAPSRPQTSPESEQRMESMEGGALDSLADTVIPFNTNTSDSAVDLFDPFPVEATKSFTKPADPVPVRTVSIKSTIDPVALSEISEDSKPTEISDSTVDLLDPFPVDTKSSPAPSRPQTSPESEQRMESMEGGALDALADTVIPFSTNTTSPEETTGDPASDLQNYTITFERKSLKNNSPWSKWTSPTVADHTEPKTDSSSPSTMDSPPISRTVETVSQEINSPDSESKKGFVFVKEYVNASAVSLQNTGLPFNEQLSSDYVYSTSSSYSYSSPSTYSGNMSACTYCGKAVGSENKITIEHLNILCHPTCFKCGVCSKPMGDLLYSMFLHKGVVHCESCYSNAL